MTTREQLHHEQNRLTGAIFAAENVNDDWDLVSHIGREICRIAKILELEKLEKEKHETH